MPFPEEIKTERQLLRPPTEADAERMFASYCQDAEVCRFMSWQPHRSIDESLTFVRKTIADNAACLLVTRLIILRASDELLGSIGGAIQSHRVQFGYCLARDAWGRGYATEAAQPYVAEIPRSGESKPTVTSKTSRPPRAGKGQPNARKDAAATPGVA